MPESLVSDDDGVETHIQLLKRCHHNNIVEKEFFKRPSLPVDEWDQSFNVDRPLD